MNRRVFLSASTLALLPVVTGCDYLLGRRWTFRERLEITVSTPKGDKVGASVTEWTFDKSPGFTYSLGGIGSTQKGEAVVLELAPGKYLFALLGKPHAVLGLMPPEEIGDSLEDELDKFSAGGGISGPVRPEEYPMLVTFWNLNDPRSVMEVKPYDLAAAFGPGYALKSFTLTVTDEQVTEGRVENVLPWMKSLKGRLKPIGEPIPKNYVPSAEENLYRNAFAGEIQP